MRSLLLLTAAFFLALGCNATSDDPATAPGDAYSGTDTGTSGVDTSTTDTAQPDTDNAVVEPEFAITSVDPGSAGTAGGDLVVIEGNGFLQGCEVWFGGRRAAETTVYSEVVIHARTPSHAPGQVNLRVVAPDETEAVAPEPFIFRDAIAIDAVTPAQSPASGGAPVTISGHGLTADTRILIGGRLLIDAQVVSSSQILGIAPPSKTVGSVDVLAFTPLNNAVAKDAFRYVKPPTLEALSPSSTLANTTAQVTLNGTALTGDAVVRFGQREAKVLFQGIDGLVVEAPAQEAGLVDVEVETADGVTSLPGSFMYVGEPTGGVEFFHVMPKTGPTVGGTEAVLTVLGVENMANLTVRFGESEATVVSVDPIEGRMRVLVPPGDGLVDITIDAPAGTAALSDAYTYIDPLSIDTVSPDSGSPDGGDTVTITGLGLGNAIEVRIGALPATILSSDTNQVVVESPPGAPGLADVSVLLEDGSVLLEDGFDYLPTDGPELYAVAPNYGAVAGSTLLFVYGAGFKPNAEVFFEKQSLGSVDFISSSELRVRTLKADEAITVDVTVRQNGFEATLTEAFSYFDPYSPYGGSWGPPIDGTVNVTVLDLYTTDPIPNALVMLWADPSTPHQGLTDDRGQITFSHPTLVGPQMVTAAKAEHTAFSVVEYDAENVTVHLIPFSPPSDGGGGGGGEALDPGEITGKVFGLGKYVVVPPQSCGYLADKGVLAAQEGPDCQSCATSADCGEGYQCQDIAGEGDFCARSCTTNADCPNWFICGAGENGTAACVPDPGKKAAFCQTTNHTLFSPPPPPAKSNLPFDDGSRAWVDLETNGYEMETRLGELAILCFGGVVRDPGYPGQSFLPLAMGVLRNVEPISGDPLPDQNVTLDIPLSKTVPVRLDGVPMNHVSNALGTPLPVTTETRLRVAWDFGAEGYWTAFDEVGSQTDAFTLPHQPESLDGPLDGLTYYFLAQVAGGPTAESGTRADKVRVIDVNRTFEFENGAWKATDSGIRRNVHSIWAVSEKDLWGVGADGLIAHYIDGYWFSQPTPANAHLNGVWGTTWDHVVAVGDAGTIVEFDGVVWSTTDSPTDLRLNAVWGTGPEQMVAVGPDVVVIRDTDGWTVDETAPTAPMNDIWGPTATRWYAAGDDGRLYVYDNGWQAPIELGVADGVSLQSVHGTATDDIWVTGALGAVFHYDGIEWTRFDTPTLVSLYDIHARDDGTAIAVGVRGTLLRFDGNAWSETEPPKNSGDLRAVWSFSNEDAGAVAVGVQAVTLGPMLQFPKINEPTSSSGGAEVFTWRLGWWSEPGPAPTFNFVEMLYAGGFPAWWTVVSADTETVDFPNLIEAGVNPFPGAGMTMKVNRVLKPGATVDNFDFWDTYNQGSWQSWAYDSVPFNPFAGL